MSCISASKVVCSTVHKWCVYCVSVDVSPNSLTSLSSYDLVPCRSKLTCTSRADKRLHFVTQKATDPPLSDWASLISSSSTHAKLLSKSETSKQTIMPFYHCSNYKREKLWWNLKASADSECRANGLLLHYSPQLSDKWEDERESGHQKAPQALPVGDLC